MYRKRRKLSEKKASPRNSLIFGHSLVSLQVMKKHSTRIRLSLDRFFRHPTAGQLLIQWFVGLICAGTFLLSLPFSHGVGRVSILDAWFTATSAVCVTGLVTLDTGTDFSLAGQWIILGLIQLGGLGILTFLALAFRAMGRRLDLQSQAAVEDALYQKNVALAFRNSFVHILKLVFSIELVGMILLFIALVPSHEPLHALYSSLFHAIASFTHAGFSIYPDSLEGLRNNHLFILVVMGLIFFGSLGHVVITECFDAFGAWRRHRREGTPLHRFSLHTRVVLRVSFFLLVAGTLLIFIGGSGSQSPAGRVQDALFLSVTARSGGLSTLSVGALPVASIWVLVVLMFIGGSPGSCAGGIKTTTLAVWWTRFLATFRGSFRGILLRRYIPEEIGRKVTMIIGFSLGWNLLGLFILLITERAPFEHVLFEQASAFGTVGLSMGLTPELSAAGKAWIILSMFVGRIGPITIAMSSLKPVKENLQYPEGRVMIG